MGGYRPLYDALILKSDQALETIANQQQYSDDELVLVKTPLNMPYYKASSGFERVDGQIELGGKHYNFVKRKVSNDTLYLLCLPNLQKTELRAEQTALAQANTEQNSENTNHRSFIKKGISLNEYAFTDLVLVFGISNGNIVDVHFTTASSILQSSTDIPVPPPRVAHSS